MSELSYIFRTPSQRPLRIGELLGDVRKHTSNPLISHIWPFRPKGLIISHSPILHQSWFGIVLLEDRKTNLESIKVLPVLMTSWFYP